MEPLIHLVILFVICTVAFVVGVWYIYNVPFIKVPSREFFSLNNRNNDNQEQIEEKQ